MKPQHTQNRHKHTYTYIQTRILTKRFRFVDSRSLSWLFFRRVSFVCCFRQLLAPFAAAQRTKLAAFLASANYMGKRYRNLMEFFPARFALFVYLFYKFFHPIAAAAVCCLLLTTWQRVRAVSGFYQRTATYVGARRGLTVLFI